MYKIYTEIGCKDIVFFLKCKSNFDSIRSKIHSNLIFNIFQPHNNFTPIRHAERVSASLSNRKIAGQFRNNLLWTENKIYQCASSDFTRFTTQKHRNTGFFNPYFGAVSHFTSISVSVPCSQTDVNFTFTVPASRALTYASNLP